MFYISFHGGDSHAVNNIYVYHDDGTPHSSPELLPTGGTNPALQELRGFGFNNNDFDNLYVLNGYKKYNDVLLYALNEEKYIFNRIFAAGADINSIFHPYDLSFDTDGNVYISSQDTNVVTQLNAEGNPSSPPAFIVAVREWFSFRNLYRFSRGSSSGY